MDIKSGGLGQFYSLISLFLVVAITITIGLIVITALGSNDYTTTAVSNEIWTGVALTAHNMAYNPIYSITAMGLNTSHKQINSTAINGANSTAVQHLNTTSNYQANVTVTYTPWLAENVSVKLNGNVLGNLTMTGTDEWTTIQAYLNSTGNNYIIFSNDGLINGTNITGINFTYSSWDTYINYTSGSLVIIPGDAGKFRTSYTYGKTGYVSNETNVITAAFTNLVITFGQAGTLLGIVAIISIAAYLLSGFLGGGKR